MKAVTLTQPWATLVAFGKKSIETRSWFTKYRGPIAIHAAKGFPGEAKRFCEASTVCDALGWPRMGEITQASLSESARLIKSLPLGAVIATATLVDCKRIVTKDHLFRDAGASSVYCSPQEILPPEPPELYFGNYEHGRFAWLLCDVRKFSQPIPATGCLGLWEWDG